VERGLLRALAGYRWAAWLWMAFVAGLARGRLDQAGIATLLLLVALGVTIGSTRLVRRDPDALLDPVMVAVEVAVGAGLLLADGWVYEPGHVFSNQQSLGVAWPLAGALAAGIAGGPLGGLLAGVTMGLARGASALLWALEAPDAHQQLSLVTSLFLYALAGVAAGYLVGLLRRAEREVASARAREEVARTLHDGVLQTLALVERRVGDPALAKLARDQEHELREYLFGAGGVDVIGRGDLGDALRGAARRFEQYHDVRVDVLVAEDLPPLPPGCVTALAGAVGEALTNVGKHAGASHVTVFVEPDGAGVFCSVKDDGVGFDPTETAEGVGLRSSIRGRIEDVGGTVEVAGRPGRGTDVRMRVPATP